MTVRPFEAGVKAFMASPQTPKTVVRNVARAMVRALTHKAVERLMREGYYWPEPRAMHAEDVQAGKFCAELERQMLGEDQPEPSGRHFPIQGFKCGVPWSAGERAYGTYAQLFGGEQTLSRLVERGGFGLAEWAYLYLGRSPAQASISESTDRVIGEALAQMLAIEQPRLDVTDELVQRGAQALAAGDGVVTSSMLHAARRVLLATAGGEHE